MNRVFVGIDVQEQRGCCFAVLDADGALMRSGWFQNPIKEVVKLLSELIDGYAVSV